MPVWFKFKLIRKPYYDESGRVLSSIKGRKNKPGVDAFFGGGKLYPVLPGKILQKIEKGDILFVLVDAPEETLKSISEDNGDFKPIQLSKKEMDVELKFVYSNKFSMNKDGKVVFEVK